MHGRPHSPATVAPSELQNNSDQYSRRQFLALGAISAAAALTGADMLTTEALWPPDHLRFGVVNKESAHLYTDNAWLVVPGFGNRHGFGMAQDFSKALGVERPVGYFVYPNDVLKIPEVRDSITQYAQPFSSLSLYLHSMGAVVALEAMRGMQTPIKRVMLNSSPLTLKDTRANLLSRGVANLSAKADLQGDFAGTYVGNIRTDYKETGWRGFPRAIHQALGQTAHGQSPKLYGSMLKILVDSNLMRHRHDFEAMFTADTEVHFFMPEDPRRDQTVDNIHAYKTWSEDFFNPLGIEVQIDRVPNAGHADTRLAVYKAESWLRNTA